MFCSWLLAFSQQPIANSRWVKVKVKVIVKVIVKVKVKVIKNG